MVSNKNWPEVKGDPCVLEKALNGMPLILCG